MKTLKKISALTLLTFALSTFSFMSLTAQTSDSDVTVIELTQTTGEFATQNLTLTPGKYQFKIVNKNVDHEVGFGIQKAQEAEMDFMKTVLPTSLASNTIKTGESAYTGVVELSEGEYVYSCPLNPTPHYTINVK